MAANHNLSIDQGSTFFFHFQYLDNNDDAVDMSAYESRMQVRRSPLSSDVILNVVGSGVTYGATAGTGGFSMNSSATGASQTGGVLLTLDAVSTAYVPYGRHFYDIEVVKGATVERLLQGRFDCNQEVTR